jgi:hypothetical protein
VIFSKARTHRHEEKMRELERDEAEMTPGARRRIRILEDRWRQLLRVLAGVCVLLVVAFTLTGWQIDKAFNRQDSERQARISASASITTFLCQRIDSVGNGVASLVRVSLDGVEPDTLSPRQRRGYDRFLLYAEEQERPPRCKQLALKIATLTGADPDTIEITPIHLNPPKTDRPKP